MLINAFTISAIVLKPWPISVHTVKCEDLVMLISLNYVARVVFENMCTQLVTISA